MIASRTDVIKNTINSHSATIIKPDGTETVLTYRPDLVEAQQIVGGYVQFVKVVGGTLVVNEEGLLLALSWNRKASNLAGDVIVGTVILLRGWRTLA